MSCHIPPYHSSLLAGLQVYIPYLHITAVCVFELVVLLLLGHMRGSIGVHNGNDSYMAKREFTEVSPKLAKWVRIKYTLIKKKLAYKNPLFKKPRFFSFFYAK